MIEGEVIDVDLAARVVPYAAWSSAGNNCSASPHPWPAVWTVQTRRRV